jgi:hypothetical protein
VAAAPTGVPVARLEPGTRLDLLAAASVPVTAAGAWCDINATLPNRVITRI